MPKMMNRTLEHTLFLLFLLIGLQLGAQTQELTLPQAVMEQYRSLYPQHVLYFQWIPNTHQYSYVEKYTTLIQENAKDKAFRTTLTIVQVNEWANTEFGWFSNFTWIDQHHFLIHNENTFLKVDPQNKTAEVLHQLPDKAQNAVFSQQSMSVVYTAENNIFVATPHTTNVKSSIIQVTNFTDKNIVSGQAIARSEFGISGGLFWSPNGKIIAFYQKDETEVHDYPLLDITSTPGTLKSIKYPMAGQKSERPRVGIFHVERNQTVYISPLGQPDDYFTNLTFTPDNNFVIVAEVNRNQDHMWLNAYDVNTGDLVRTLLEETNEKWIEPEHPAFFPDKTSNNFVWISEKNGFNNLYYYDFHGKLIRQLTDNSFALDEIITAHKNKIYFFAPGVNPTNKLVYSVDLNGKQQLVSQHMGVHTTFAISHDGTLLYDEYSNTSTPFQGMIYNAKRKVEKIVFDGKNPLENYNISVNREMLQSNIDTLVAGDGSTLYTRLIKPTDFDPMKKYPVLIYVYGGPHAQMITNSWCSGASLWMYWLAQQGYLVFTVDGRGSARRGFAFESQIHRQLGKVEMEDQLTGVDYLKSLGYVDEKRIAVHGWSFGGFMTTSLLLHHPGVFTTGVAGGPVTDWSYYEIMYGERYMDRPEENPDGYQQTSLLTHADKLKDKLLLIHGTVDDVVVMQHNFALIKQFVESGIQVDFFPYPMHPHNVRGKDRVHLMEKVLNYIIENNK